MLQLGAKGLAGMPNRAAAAAAEENAAKAEGGGQSPPLPAARARRLPATHGVDSGDGSSAAGQTLNGLRGITGGFLVKGMTRVVTPCSVEVCVDRQLEVSEVNVRCTAQNIQHQIAKQQKKQLVDGSSADRGALRGAGSSATLSRGRMARRSSSTGGCQAAASRKTPRRPSRPGKPSRS